jgi:hypothetical protein
VPSRYRLGPRRLPDLGRHRRYHSLGLSAVESSKGVFAVIAGDADGVLRFWDAASGAKLWTL